MCVCVLSLAAESLSRQVSALKARRLLKQEEEGTLEVSHNNNNNKPPSSFCASNWAQKFGSTKWFAVHETWHSEQLEAGQQRGGRRRRKGEQRAQKAQSKQQQQLTQTLPAFAALACRLAFSCLPGLLAGLS